MKHLQLNEAYVKGGFHFFDDLLSTFKERAKLCVEIAKKHHFTVIQELRDTSSDWKITFVFVNDKYPNYPNDKTTDDSYSITSIGTAAEHSAFEMYNAFSEEINDLKPSQCKYFKKRFLSRVDIVRLDIKDWEKSSKLSSVNDKTGIMEAKKPFPRPTPQPVTRNPEFVCCEVWLDWT